MSFAPPAWYQDPSDPRQLRWWDGVQWTAHVAAAPATYAAALRILIPSVAIVRPRTPMRLRWIAPIIAGSLVLMLIAAIAIGTAGVLTLNRLEADASGTSALHALAFDESDAPRGMVWASGAPTKQIVTGSAVASSRAQDPIIPDRCYPMLTGAPVRTSDFHSKDLMLPLGTFINANPKGSQVWISATARAFSSTQAAADEVSELSKTVASCTRYVTADWSANQIAPLTVRPNGLPTAGWSANMSGLQSTHNIEENVELQRGNLVVRAACIVSNRASTSHCASWWNTVAHDLDHPRSAG